MKYFYNLFVKSILNFSFTIGFTFLIACNVGCFSINTIGQVGGSVLEELGDVNIFSDEEELTIGKAFDEQHAKEVKFYTDPVVTSYIVNYKYKLTLSPHGRRGFLTSPMQSVQVISKSTISTTLDRPSLNRVNGRTSATHSELSIQRKSTRMLSQEDLSM